MYVDARDSGELSRRAVVRAQQRKNVRRAYSLQTMRRGQHPGTRNQRAAASDTFLNVEEQPDVPAPLACFGVSPADDGTRRRGRQQQACGNQSQQDEATNDPASFRADFHLKTPLHGSVGPVRPESTLDVEIILAITLVFIISIKMIVFSQPRSASNENPAGTPASFNTFFRKAAWTAPRRRRVEQDEGRSGVRGATVSAALVPQRREARRAGGGNVGGSDRIAMRTCREWGTRHAGRLPGRGSRATPG